MSDSRNESRATVLIHAPHSSFWITLCLISFLAGCVISGYFAFSIGLESSRKEHKDLHRKIDLVTWSLQFYRKEVVFLGLDLPTQSELERKYEKEQNE